MTLMTDVPAEPVADAPAADAPAPAAVDAPPADAPAPVEPAAADKPAADVIPEKYDLQIPEGVNMDAAGVEAFAEFARDAGLTQDKAGALLAKMAPVMAQRQQQAIEAMHAEWAGQSKSDTEFGGDKLNENLAVAKRAMDKFGTPELTKLLNESGMGNHPEIIRAFYRAGKAISEDRFVGGGRATAPVDPSKRMYPTMS